MKVIQHLMDTVWFIAADAFFSLFFLLRLCTDRCNERRLDVQTGKKKINSLYLYSIQKSNFLTGLTKPLFCFFLLLFFLLFGKSSQKNPPDTTGGCRWRVQWCELCCSHKENKKQNKDMHDQKKNNKTNLENKITEMSIRSL